MKRPTKKSKKGFTLVELVVVIAILAILAAIAVPQLLGFQARAREQADKQTAVQIRNALSLLNANGEIAGSGTAVYTVAAATDAASAAGFINPNLSPAAAFAAQGDVVTLVQQLTGTVKVEGTKDITVALAADGAVTVTSP